MDVFCFQLLFVYRQMLRWKLKDTLNGAHTATAERERYRARHMLEKFEQISPENMKYRKQTHSFDLSCYVEDDTRKLLQRVNKNFGNVNAQRHPNKWISNGFINVDPVEICQSQSIRAHERVGKKIDTQNWKRFSTVKLFAEQRVVYDSIFLLLLRQTCCQWAKQQQQQQ